MKYVTLYLKGNECSERFKTPIDFNMLAASLLTLILFTYTKFSYLIIILIVGIFHT